MKEKEELRILELKLEQERKEALRTRIKQVKAELVDLSQQHLQLLKEQQESTERVKAQKEILDQNRSHAAVLDKQMLKEVTGYHELRQCQTCLKVLCVMLDQNQKWDSKVQQLFEDKAYVLDLGKKIIHSTTNPLPKRLMAFKVEAICKEKLEFLSKVVEKEGYTPEGVQKISQAIAVLAKWQLGVIYQRRL